MTRPATGTVMQVGDAIYMTGAGRVAEGRPAVPRSPQPQDAASPSGSGSATTQSYETVVALLDDNATRMITRRETKTDPPNYFIRDVAAKTLEGR